MSALTLILPNGTFVVDPAHALNGGVFGSTFGSFLIAVSASISTPVNITASGIVSAIGYKILAVDGAAAGNASAGQAQLNGAGGLLVVNTTAVIATSLIFLSHADNTGALALYSLSSEIVPGVSFTARSAGSTATDKFNWLIINRI